MLVPQDGQPRRLDLRPLFKGNRELAGIVVQVAEPEGFWIGADIGHGFDFVYLSFADAEKQAKPL